MGASRQTVTKMELRSVAVRAKPKGIGWDLRSHSAEMMWSVQSTVNPTELMVATTPRVTPMGASTSKVPKTEFRSVAGKAESREIGWASRSHSAEMMVSCSAK